MSVKICKYLKCDRCGYCLGQFKYASEYKCETKNIRWQRIIAKKHGWLHVKSAGLDYCGDCRESAVSPRAVVWMNDNG